MEMRARRSHTVSSWAEQKLVLWRFSVVYRTKQPFVGTKRISDSEAPKVLAMFIGTKKKRTTRLQKITDRRGVICYKTIWILLGCFKSYFKTTTIFMLLNRNMSAELVDVTTRIVPDKEVPYSIQTLGPKVPRVQADFIQCLVTHISKIN